MPKILFVSVPGASHAAQWVNQLNDTDWEVIFFPSLDTPYLDMFRDLTVYSKDKVRFAPEAKVHVVSLMPINSPRMKRVAQRLVPKKFDSSRWLAEIIESVRPDYIHSMEMQHGAYLVDQARAHLSGPLPPWIITPWGSDLYLYKRLEAHRDKLRSCLEHAQYFWAECCRDYDDAREMGFKGEMLDSVPASGGYDIESYKKLNATPPSQRKFIMVKGYQSFAGRALNAFTAMRECKDALKGYTVILYLSCHAVDVAAELFTQDTGIPVVTLRFPLPHEEIQSNFARSRIHMGLSISDGLPTSVIESMGMGTFPIQSDSSCAFQWIEDGKNGLLVPADDPAAVARALQRALEDDALVDKAAKTNLGLIHEKFEYHRLREKILSIYDALP